MWINYPLATNKMKFLSKNMKGRKMMGIPTDEQETVINFGRTDEYATVFTTDTTVITKLDKLIESKDSEWKLKENGTVNGETVSKTYTCPKSLISFRKSRQKQTLTDEQKKNIAERLNRGKLHENV